ncbi:unnamed protein product [Gongylonema pulchrum]|uniref:SNF7 family protein n=1 Tax=Gongylonema pulchrum TaxID=637853 RepID=A0A183D5G9_9BILA|nr:unnamed protein product [Gongylonema pulchrum]
MIRDKEREKQRSEQRALREAKRVCALIAKMVRDFWQNVEKVVDLRIQEVIEGMKRKALDQQLEMMVGHADKLSEMVQEDEGSSVSSGSDDDMSISDIEMTEGNVKEEMEGLMAEGNLELDDLLDSLPPGYLEGISKSTSKIRGLPCAAGSILADGKRHDESEASTDYATSEVTQGTALLRLLLTSYYD